MPKISVNGGPSYEGHEGLVKDGLERYSEIDPDHQGRTPLVGEPTEDGDNTPAGIYRKEDESSQAGNDSLPSGEKQNSTDETKRSDLPKRARTTESPSDADRGGSSSAPSTGGSTKGFETRGSTAKK